MSPVECVSTVGAVCVVAGIPQIVLNKAHIHILYDTVFLDDFQ